MYSHPVYITAEIWGLPLTTEHRVLLSLIVYDCKKHGDSILRNTTLSEELNCSVGKIRKLLTDLETEGYIRIHAKTVCPPAWSKDTTPETIRRITTDLKD